MHVSVNILRDIDLNNPVHGWEVDTPRGNVRAKHDSLFLLHELEVDGCPFVLVLLPMQLKQVLAHLKRLESLVRKPDLLPGREKDEAFQLGVRFEETKKHVQFGVALDHHVVVQQGRRRNLLQLVLPCLSVSAALHHFVIVDLDVLVVPS